MLTSDFFVKLAISAIEAYQKWLSPLKGFKCVHGRICDERTCSAYGKYAFKNYGFSEGFRKTAQRLEACREIASILNVDAPLKNRSHIAQNQGGFVDADCGSCDLPSCDLPSCDFPSSGANKCWGPSFLADAGCDIFEAIAVNRGKFSPDTLRVGPLKDDRELYKHKKSGQYYAVDPTSSEQWDDGEVLSKKGLRLTKQEARRQLGPRGEP